MPRDIFDAIPDKPWPRLRLEQGEVLKAWYERRNQRDIVIKQNTGGGKTAAGLLIAQSSLNEGIGPAVYLTPNTYLAAQVVKEAEALHLSYATNPRDEKFLSGEAILITTFQRVVNGRSAFGVFGSNKASVPLGIVVIDDAHSALTISERQFQVSIPRRHKAYRAVLDLFEDTLKAQNASSWRAIDTNQAGAPLRVPFWAWSARQDQIRAILSPVASDEDEKWIFFSWPVVDQALDLSVATATADEIEIRPPCSPIEFVPSFAKAKRRVYLTATLSDDGVLVTDLGADPQDVSSPISPERAADLGDRMILAPLALNPRLGEDAIREMVQSFSQGEWGAGEDGDPINVVVLVPSNKRAQLWKSYADRICKVGDLAGVVEELKAGKHLGVVVMVNEYDGVDLPGDACRLLVIDGVPFPLSPSEAREAAGLSGTETFAARQTQKIEQGMGRGIRDAEDHCAVLLLGSQLAMSLRSRKARLLYSPATQAQIELSLQISEQIHGEGVSSIAEALTQFLKRTPGWLRASRAATAGVEYDHSGHISNVAIARRRAFDLARAGQPHEATQTLLDGLRGLPPYEKGWYQEEAASYADRYDHNQAQKILREARLANINVLLPIVAVPVKVLRPTATQAASASAYLAERYETGVELALGFETLLNAIAFDPERTDDTEQAFADLGSHLGFESERPDKLYGTGPDVLWIVSENSAILIELKSGVTREDARIIKSELDQVSGHINWFHSHYGKGTQFAVALVHPTAAHQPNGTPPSGLRVIDPDSLGRVKRAVRDMAKALATDENWRSPEIVRELLTSHQLTGTNSLLKGAPHVKEEHQFVQNPLTVLEEKATDGGKEAASEQTCSMTAGDADVADAPPSA